MVLIDDQKFACQSCIKGHRSSGCNHTDRPLFEIRKKGRPATQCDTCRDLRRTKKLHVRCACPGRKDPEAEVGPVQIQSTSSSAMSRKAGRKIPIVPKLPHGVKDLEQKVLLSPQDTTPPPSTPTQALGAMATRAQIAPSTSILSPASPAPPGMATSMAGPVRSCCCRKPTKHSRSPSLQSMSETATPMVSPTTETGRTLNMLTLDFVLPRPASSAPSFSEVTSPTLTMGEAGEQQEEPMDCLCGPSCLCMGCTKHKPYGDENDTEATTGARVGCPPDCPSCVNNEDGFVWHRGPSAAPSSSKFSFTSRVGPRPSLSDTRRHDGIPSPFWDAMSGVEMEEDYDDELDAEGSPDPAYATLPDIEASESSFSLNSSPHKGSKIASGTGEYRTMGKTPLDGRPSPIHHSQSIKDCQI